MNFTLAIKCIEISIYFETLYLTMSVMSSVDLIMIAIHDTTHITTILSFSTGNGERFNGNALCSCDDSVTQPIYN